MLNDIVDKELYTDNSHILRKTASLNTTFMQSRLWNR